MPGHSVIVLVGPTASGKTSLSIELARAIPAEIVSADSRQIYRNMTIGTAKPEAGALAAVKHHGIDICDPGDYFSAGEFCLMARSVICDIQSRNKTPIVAGGSGLYIQALIDGIFTGNYRDLKIRRQIQKEADAEGWKALYSRLQGIDPLAASRIHLNDHRRILRALEVYQITGQSISTLQARETLSAPFPVKMWGLYWPRDLLYRRIEHRVDQMVLSGLVTEVQSLLEAGYTLKNNSLNSVGYKEIIGYLNGEWTYHEAIDLIKRNTRRFAKRQMTWFRKEHRIRWIEMNASVHLEILVKKILDDWGSKHEPGT